MKKDKEEKTKGPEEAENEDVVFAQEGDEGVSEKDPQAAVRRLKEELKLCLGEKKEYLDGWQRAKADFANARKQEEKSREEFAKYAKERFLLELLPLAESFEMAFSNKEAWESVSKNWRVGVEYIHSQLMNIFEANGLQELNPVGNVFDPNEHQSLGMVPVVDESDDMKIIEVVQKGYVLNGKVIRPARVRVGEFQR